ncbi:Zn-ribbon domain-containing OB-fold protein [Nocardia abscessus]|uniref:Zn-ribbon domain-containing OB-fold protein n=1 Tax=Nocardia abscessus TaxID=120957 RepID=UPI00245852E5|nr:OB-fold domain-containing protein [Nocardia abscessus]
MHTNKVNNASNVDSDGSALCRNGMLMLYLCVQCDKLLAPITAACSSCGSDELESVPSSGTGSVVSWRVVDRAPADRHGELVPLTIAIVELDEGPLVYTSIEGEIPSSPGRPMRVRFQPHPREGRFPVFAVTTDEPSLTRATRPGRSHCSPGVARAHRNVGGVE